VTGDPTTVDPTTGHPTSGRPTSGDPTSGDPARAGTAADPALAGRGADPIAGGTTADPTTGMGAGTHDGVHHGTDPAGPTAAGTAAAGSAAGATHAGSSAAPASAGSDAEGRERLIPQQRATEYGSRWDQVKGDFVDEPRRAVAGADALVGELLDELQELFGQQRRSLDQGLDKDETSTEDLRLALRRYRSFFDRLLSI